VTEQKSFFLTIPGILSGIAAVVTAVVGLIYALSEIGVIESQGNKESQTVVVAPETVVVPSPTVSVAPESPKEQTTDGWAIIGYYRQGKFSNLKLMVHGDSPAIGRRYDVVDNFRLVQKQLEESKGKAVITLGMVHRGDSVEILDIEIEPGTRKVAVWAKLRAVLHKR
jgi:hypothetical protein